MPTPLPKRERTRTALLVAALELFAARGYDATTTAEIAKRAGVSEMTLFRHFATKDALLVADPYDPLIAEAIRRRPDDEAPIAAAVRGIRDAWNAIPPPATAAVRDRLRIVADTPSLHGALAKGSRETEDAIAEALIERGIAGPDARVVGAAVIAGLNRALLDWSLTDEPEIGTALVVAFRALEAR